MTRLGAVLLAAGCSSRFGADNKLLAAIDGRPIVRTVAETLLEADCIEAVLVVTGHESEAVKRVFAGLSVGFVFNANWRDGMGGSIALGVSRFDPELDGAAIVPGDMAFLSVGVVETLGAAFRDGGGEEIVVPATPAGAQRNPVIWPRRHFGLLEGLSGPEGGKHLLSELAASCRMVRIADERALSDIDAPADLSARALDHL